MANTEQILAANAEDLKAARAAGTPNAMLDRLALDPKRVDGIAAGLRQVAGLPDPVGEVLRGYTLPNGLQLREQRVPLGVIGIIYEGRPNVTVDAFGLALKSGNAYKNKIYYSNAGQALPVFVDSKNNKAFEIECYGVPIGLIKDRMI